MEWTQGQLDLLEEYHQAQITRAEEDIQTSSYPPDEQKEIDINQAIVWLVRKMKDEKSWIYKLCHPPSSSAENV